MISARSERMIAAGNFSSFHRLLRPYGMVVSNVLHPHRPSRVRHLIVLLLTTRVDRVSFCGNAHIFPSLFLLHFTDSIVRNILTAILGRAHGYYCDLTRPHTRRPIAELEGSLLKHHLRIYRENTSMEF
jgi:hypothetical protein